MKKVQILSTPSGDNNFRMFKCPGCKSAHAIDDKWTVTGTAEKPTIRASVLVNAGSKHPKMPVCHSFITDGQIEFLSDCTHELAGQTVDLEAWNEDD